MPIPGDLCLLETLKLYIGGASPVDSSNDSILAKLITAASTFIARFLDRDLMSLGGQGFSSVASVGSDAGGAFITLGAPLPAVPAAGTAVNDLTSGTVTAVVAPAGGLSNSAGKLYLNSTGTFAAGDSVALALLLSFVETYDGSGKLWQSVRQWPIVNLISVVDVPSGQSYPLGSIVADSELPRIMFATPAAASPPQLVFPNGTVLGQLFNRGIQNLRISYTAGYPIPPPDLAQAACELALLWFKDRDRIGVSAESILGTHVNFFNNADLLPQTRLKLNYYRRTIRGY